MLGRFSFTWKGDEAGTSTTLGLLEGGGEEEWRAVGRLRT
jgi:hypothetical protein